MRGRPQRSNWSRASWPRPGELLHHAIQRLHLRRRRQFTNVPAGDDLRLPAHRGRNSDCNNFLRGTFTLSTSPYIDATIGTDNRQWTRGDGDLDAARPSDGRLSRPGEARWFKFRVVPGQQATLDLTSPAGLRPRPLRRRRRRVRPARRRRRPRPAGGGLSLRRTGRGDTDAGLRPERHDDSHGKHEAAGLDAVRATDLRARVYAPRVYAPRVYAPRVYAPADLRPAGLRTRLVRARPRVERQLPRRVLGRPEPDPARWPPPTPSSLRRRSSASTGNTHGYFYVRVQGTTTRSFDAEHAVQPERSASPAARAAAGSRAFDTTPTIGSLRQPATVIVTDTNKLIDADRRRRRAQHDLSHELRSRLATRHRRRRRRRPHDRRACRRCRTRRRTHPSCPYATNLVAHEIKDIVDRFRGDATKYVVIAGGDDVIPFFRYPDTSGLGQESQFEPP